MASHLSAPTAPCPSAEVEGTWHHTQFFKMCARDMSSGIHALPQVHSLLIHHPSSKISLNLKILFLCGWLFCLHVLKGAACMPSIKEGRRGCGVPWAGVTSVVSHHEDAGNWTPISAGGAGALNCWVIQPQLSPLTSPNMVGSRSLSEATNPSVALVEVLERLRNTYTCCGSQRTWGANLGPHASNVSTLD